VSEAQDRRFQGRVGTTIRDKWHVDAFLNAGSMAAVYAGTHRNGMRGALKILHKHLSRDPSLQKRFLREAYLANKVSHPSALKVLDDDLTEDGCAFLVLELLDGETLEVRRHRLGRLELMELLDIGDQLLDVLAVAHAAGVIHRDLKPENVLLLRNGMIKVLDFGIAQVWDGARSSELTETGTILGSPSYMPPEQARGARDEIDARSDIWAAGATLFTLLSGQTVHRGDSAHKKLLSSATQQARLLRDVAPDLPRSVTNVIDRALAFDQSERWPDAVSMREALKWARIGLGGTTQPRHSSAPPPTHTTEETVTDFDLRAAQERAAELRAEEGGGSESTMRQRRAIEEAVTVVALPNPASASNAATDSEPTIRREPPPNSLGGILGQRVPGGPPPVPMPHARSYAPTPAKRAPRLLGFVLGAAALLATGAVAALFTFGPPRMTPALGSTATSGSEPVASAPNGAPSDTVAAAAPSAAPSGSTAEPLAALHAEIDPGAAPSARATPSATYTAPPVVAASDLPRAAPTRRPRPRPTPTAVPTASDTLPSFPIPEPEPTTAAPATTPGPTPSPTATATPTPTLGKDPLTDPP
jgi:serine/threonine-protein kinase